MSEFGHSYQLTARTFAGKHGINLETDIKRLPMRRSPPRPRLVQFDETGRIDEHITAAGADYFFSRLDYLTAKNKVVASRYIAKIMAGKRTEIAYWTKAAPSKHLNVHMGEGVLIVSKPDDPSIDEIQLDPISMPRLTLPSGNIYAIKAADQTPEPLVVSGLYMHNVDWGELEIVVQPGQESIEVSDEGAIIVPEGFRLLNPAQP